MILLGVLSHLQAVKLEFVRVLNSSINFLNSSDHSRDKIGDISVLILQGLTGSDIINIFLDLSTKLISLSNSSFQHQVSLTKGPEISSAFICNSRLIGDISFKCRNYTGFLSAINLSSLFISIVFKSTSSILSKGREVYTLDDFARFFFLHINDWR